MATRTRPASVISGSGTRHDGAARKRLPSNHGTRITFHFTTKATMTTYTELKSQADALMAQAEQIRKEERARAIADIQAKMAE